MPNRPLVAEDLVVIAALVRLVAEEVDGSVVDALRTGLLRLDVLQAVCFVPALGEDVEADLAADRVAANVGDVSAGLRVKQRRRAWPNSRQTQIRKLLLDRLNKRLPNPMLQVKLLILHPLLHTRIPANRTNINHPIPELHKRTPLHRNIQIRDVSKQEIDQLLVRVLAEPLDERMRGQRHAHTDSGEPVLREAEVEEGGYRDAGGAELLLLFGEVRAANEADRDFVAEGGEELEHFWGNGLGGSRMG